MQEHLKLENQLCFKYYVISKEIIKLYKPLLTPLGLTYTGYITMLALWEEDHISVNTLGKILTLDSGTLTPLLKKLEHSGYLKRIRSIDDERKVIIVLTDDGKALKQSVDHVPKAIVNALVKDHTYNDEELTKIQEVLDIVFNLVKPI